MAPHRHLVLAAAFGAGLLASSVLAQSGPDKKDAVLKGPEVKDRNVPGAAPNFGMNMGNGRRFERIPIPAFRKALEPLLTEGAAADIVATTAQRDLIKTSLDEFEVAVRKFRRENAKEVAELQAAAGIPAGRGRAERQRPADDDAMKDLTPEQRKAREDAAAKLRELQARAPKAEDMYTIIWTELSEPQRSLVETSLDSWREEQAKKREEDYVKRQTRGKDAAAKPAPTPEMKAPDAMSDPMVGKPDAAPAAKRPEADKPASDKSDARPRTLAERRQRLLRIFESLSPAEQDQLLSRLEERIKNGRPAAGNGGRRNATPAQTDKPAADPERVKVPNPDQND